MNPLSTFTVLLGFVSLSHAQQAHANPRGPLIPATESPRRCELEETKLSGTVTLERDCSYQQRFVIEEPNTTLDCNGAELLGPDGYSVNIKTGADHAVVRNCYIRGGKGIAVRARKLREGESDDEVRALAPRDVILEHLHISSSENVSVHLHTHTVGVTLRHSIISDGSGPCVYLSPYGRGHIIEDNLISGCGHTKPDGSPRIAWYRREGIAIDASSEHVITGNEITGNAFGGILLYKNCWEHAAEEPDSRPRTDHARANLIRGNHFSEQPFGVWVAARQSRDLAMMGCGDPTPYDNPIQADELFHPSFASYSSAYIELYLISLNSVSAWPDFAEENVINDNSFEAISHGGIRIEDDDTEVRGNLFIGDFDYVFVGAPFRARLAGQPVLNTILHNNSFLSDSAERFEDRLALIPDEHLNTSLEANYRACLSPSGEPLRHGALLSADSAEPTGGCEPSAWRCEDGALLPEGLEEGCLEQTAGSEAGSEAGSKAGSEAGSEEGSAAGVEPSRAGAAGAAAAGAELDNMAGVDQLSPEPSQSGASGGCMSEPSTSNPLALLLLCLVGLASRRACRQARSSSALSTCK